MDPTDTPTIDLLRRAAHDRDCLSQLLERHEDHLRRRVAREFDRRLAAIEQPEDVVQHVLTAVTRAIAHASFDHEAAFRIWLNTLVHNRVIDLRKSLGRAQRSPRGARSIEDTAGINSRGSRVRIADVIPSTGPTLSSNIRREEERASIWQVLEQLPASHAAVIRMVRLEGLPTDEVARRLGKQPAAVRKMLSRALEGCRAVMGLLDREARA